MMNVRIIFGVSVLSSFFAWGVATFLYFWPELQTLSAKTALMALIAPHMFRFVGLTFLVPGVVSETLPKEFARPAAYGDLVAALLAIGASLDLAMNSRWGIGVVWVFNVWGVIDLINAYYQGLTRLSTTGPTPLGSAFYIPTFVVPALLTSHALIFWLLLRGTP